jgi:hypothetical protein
MPVDESHSQSSRTKIRSVVFSDEIDSLASALATLGISADIPCEHVW